MLDLPMTQTQIEAKLRQALNEDITREKDVMYILGESRRLLEKLGNASHFALTLYCHWALHTDLTRPNTTHLSSWHHTILQTRHCDGLFSP
jgi:hypothetical protein